MSANEMNTTVQQLTNGIRNMTVISAPAIAPALMITQADIDDEEAAMDEAAALAEADGNGA